VKAAVKRKHEKTAMRQGRRIDLPEITPSRFKAVKKTGRINANPKIKTRRKTKSKYSSNLTRLSKLLGVNPRSKSTALGSTKYANVEPVKKSGVATREKMCAVLFSFL